MYNDYELVSLAQERNEDAINILHEKYKHIILNKSKKVFSLLKLKGLELSDIVQEATIGFEEAIRGFNQDDEASFYTFACVCIDRQIKTLILKNNRMKHRILNEALALENDSENNLIDVLTDEVTPETTLLSSENTLELYNEIKDVLTSLECNIFDLRLQGFDYGEISKILELDSKDVYNAMSRIKNKVNKILNK